MELNPVPLSPLDLPPLYARCNSPPSQVDYKLASQYVGSIDEELEECQAEIDALEIQLAKLRERVKALQNTRDEFGPMLSPWRRLPVDVLVEILQIAVNPGLHRSQLLLSPDFQSTDRAHFKNLRSVCRLWRDVAFATPSLWTSIWVDFNECYKEVPNVKAVIRWIGKYFERAGSSLPLDLGFRWDDWDLGRDRRGGGNHPLNLLFTDVWLPYLFSQRSRLSKISFFATAHHFRIFETQLQKARSSENSGCTWVTEHLQVRVNSSPVRGSLKEHTLGTSGVIEASFPNLEFAAVSANTDEALDLNLLKQGHSGLLAFEWIVSRHSDTRFKGLGAFTHLHELYLSVPVSTTDYEEYISPVSVHDPSFDFPSLRLLFIDDLPDFVVLSKLRTPVLEVLGITSTIPSQWHLGDKQSRLSSSISYLIDFIRRTEGLSTFQLSGWFVLGDETLLRLFQALDKVYYICTDVWFNEESNANQCEDSMLSNMVQLCIHLPDAETPYPSSSSTSSSSSLSAGGSRAAETSNRECSPTTLKYCRQPAYWKSSLAAYLEARSSAMAMASQSREDTLDDEDIFDLDVVIPHLALDDSEGGKDARDTVEMIQRLPGINLKLRESCVAFGDS
ncbi:hypothetical protein MD484_g4836, partial [Candolleomyces efflorescens]